MDAAGGSKVNAPSPTAAAFFSGYSRRLQDVLQRTSWEKVAWLADDLLNCWKSGRQVFLCGNGGSAANAMHIANDFLYGVSKADGSGLRVNALSANPAVITCLANDEGYDAIFALQLAVQANKSDVLIALSGSGNSANIVKALEQARKSGMRSYAILGYQGGKAKGLADVVIHFEVEDMQLAEDLQLVVGHMLMQWLYVHRPHQA
jgi:D-sedoheptulose 7-phosphate isomerase